jgi:hypothetical protein
MKFIFTLSIWADWHIDQLVRNVVPSLRAPGNLDSVDYLISVHTRPTDAKFIQDTLAGLVSDIKTTVPDNMTNDRAGTHPTVHTHKEADRAVAGEGDVWALLAPDMVWAEGTFDYYRRLIESGKKAIFRPLLRVDSDRAGTITDFSKRSLARVALKAEHDVVKKFYRAQGHKFSRHTEMVTWHAPGGLINKTITPEVQVCLAKLELLGGHRLAPELAPDEMAVICDSDEGITLAMTAPDANLEWVSGTIPLTSQFIKDFVGQYPSPVCRYVASKSYRLHDRDIDTTQDLVWRQLEQYADDFIETAFERDT